MKTLAGHLLIAVPELPDPNFFRSVVLIFNHEEEGASGVILNRPTDVTVRKLWSEIDEFEYDSDCDDLVHAGGPVEGPLIALHTSLVHAHTNVVPGVFISTDPANLDAIVAQTEHPFRLYVGYAGWGPGQLDAEMEVGGWLTMAAEAEHVFASPDELWKQVCEEFGQDILKTQYGNQLPGDPSLN